MRAGPRATAGHELAQYRRIQPMRGDDATRMVTVKLGAVGSRERVYSGHSHTSFASGATMSFEKIGPSANFERYIDHPKREPLTGTGIPTRA